MIIYLLVSLSVLISIFYLPINIVIFLCIVFFITYALVCKSLNKALKRVLYILPYFLSVLIMQSISHRGQTYNIAQLHLDKQGVDTTIIYFLRFSTILYFIGISLKLSTKIKLPKNKIGEETIRIIIFFTIIKKQFFKHILEIKNREITYKQKFIIIKKIIISIYFKTFENYPYNKYIDLYYSRKYK